MLKNLKFNKIQIDPKVAEALKDQQATAVTTLALTWGMLLLIGVARSITEARSEGVEDEINS